MVSYQAGLEFLGAHPHNGSDKEVGKMKKCLVLLLVFVAVQAEAVLPQRQPKVSLRTDVKVKSSKDRSKKEAYSVYGRQTTVQKDTKEAAFLSIEVRNVSPQVVRDLKIVYKLFELQIDRSTNKRIIYTGRNPRTEKLVATESGQLKIEELKPLEKKVVESQTLETSYQSTQDRAWLISRTTTTGSKFGGYIVEYYVGDKLVKRDASSRNLLEAYMRSLQGQQPSNPLKMRTDR